MAPAAGNPERYRPGVAVFLNKKCCFGYCGSGKANDEVQIKTRMGSVSFSDGIATSGVRIEWEFVQFCRRERRQRKAAQPNQGHD
jgi:hypothetical protein